MQTTSIPVLSDSAYRVESELGSGGGGVVYKAWHMRLKKYVVIKELKRGSQSDLETQRNEVEALKNVKSAYLPQVLDFLTEGDRVFTVMEFIEGESLDKLLSRGQKFSQAQVVKWYGQIVSALEVIHNKGICHRDVKPANIMLMPNGDVCLIDFNAALVSGNDVRLISRSLGYASPEQYEIYSKYKNSHSASIRLGSSSVTVRPVGATGIEHLPADVKMETIDDNLSTELLLKDNKTETFTDSQTTELLLKDSRTGAIDDSQSTEILPEDDDLQKTDLVDHSPISAIDWKRSDVYSLGATMYHILTGKRPPEQAMQVVSLSKIGQFSEGIAYIIEQSMRINPAERFESATVLADVVRNIHRHDSRWRVSHATRVAAIVILPLTFVLFAAIALYGYSVIAQEKEEAYYTAIYEIENGTDPQTAYDTALAVYWDRIDPYYAMAKRTWNDGDIEVCREYIEQNLGNIAGFQTVPEAAHSFGDIYFILGNCYYYRYGKPDYDIARGNFEIAVKYIKDNPVYYRDYAIALARTDNIAEAERILKQADFMGLESDSLNLINGEIGFARRDYEKAVGYFNIVIIQSNDEYLRYRAYHTSDEIFRLQGRPERSVEMLSGALNRIPPSRVPEMIERLADAYAKIGDYDNAITLFEQLTSSGAPQFHLLEGLAILLETVGEFDRAATVLSQMADYFPNDYRVPMRQAYLEADRQSQIENEKRDYTLSKIYYEAAVVMYNDNVKPGESDPEMQQLGILIEQLRANNWID